MVSTATFELEITKSPLVAWIVNGEHHGAAWNKTVAINARNMSFDPDYPDDVASLSYTWFCRLQRESFPMDGDSVSRDSPVPPSGVDRDPVHRYGGCFGEGPGVIPYNTGEFTLDTEMMAFITHYVLRVEVRKDSRMAYYEQNFFVGAADPPSITLR